jgi:hypothetical protein
MKDTRNTLYLALVSALFLFVGTLSLRAAAAQQPADQADSSSTKKPSNPKQAPAAAPATAAPTAAAASTPAAKPAPATTPAASTPAASTPAASKSAATQQTPPAKSNLMVWVNTDSGIYHKPGTRFYGKTKQGKYMSEADAIKAGYRPAAKN